MRKSISKSAFSIAFSALILEAPACTLRPPTAPKQRVRIEISSRKPLKHRAAPASVSDFTCFAVNVTGGGVPVAEIGAGCKMSKAPYLGAYAGWVPASGGTLEVLVPAGAERLIQVLGIAGAGATCQSFDAVLAQAVTVYEVGRTTVDLFAETTVNISSTFDSSQPEAFSCSGSTASPTPSPSATASSGPGTWDGSKWDNSTWGN